MDLVLPPTRAPPDGATGIFGFSSYMSQMHSHLNVVLIFPVPLAVYLADAARPAEVGSGRSRALGLVAGLLGVETLPVDLDEAVHRSCLWSGREVR